MIKAYVYKNGEVSIGKVPLGKEIEDTYLLQEGCTSSNCLIHKQKGMCTNSRCRCLPYMPTKHRIAVEKALFKIRGTHENI